MIVLINTLDFPLYILKIERALIVGFVDLLWHVFNCSVPYKYSDWISPLMYDFITSSIYTGCPRRNVPDFGRMFLKLNTPI
jgi:hypothetical protein